MTTPLLDRVIARIRLLSAEQLQQAERWLDSLACGAGTMRSLVAPLSVSPLRSTTDAQRLAAMVAAVKSGDASPHSKDWPHAPLHRLSEHGTYMVTAGTLHKEHWFRGAERLDYLESALLRIIKGHGWRLEAWAVFSNHYHFVAHAEAGAESVRKALSELHRETAMEVNQRDGTPGRKVWHNFWDTKLTFEKSYFARLSYVHQNGVKHGLVPLASQYRWCSAGWFERTATRAQIRTVYSFKIDKLNVRDDYEPL